MEPVNLARILMDSAVAGAPSLSWLRREEKRLDSGGARGGGTTTMRTVNTAAILAAGIAGIILFLITVTLISAGKARSQGAVAPAETRHMPTSVGPYLLARSVRETSGLTELSPLEYSAFRSGDPIDPYSAVPQERIFKAVPVRFEGLEWQVMVASTKDRIYKISLRHSAKNSVADRIFQQMVRYFTDSIGEPSESSRPPSTIGKFAELIWDAEEGNLVLERGDFKTGESFVNWYLTSNIMMRQ